MQLRDFILGREQMISMGPDTVRTGRISHMLAVLGVSVIAVGAPLAVDQGVDIPFVAQDRYELEATDYIVVADAFRAGDDGEIATERVEDHDYEATVAMREIVPISDPDDPRVIAEALVGASERMFASAPLPLLIEGRIFDPATSKITHDVENVATSKSGTSGGTLRVASYGLDSPTGQDAGALSKAIFDEINDLHPSWSDSGNGPVLFPVVDGQAVVPYTFEQYARAIETAQDLRLNNVTTLQLEANADPALYDQINDPAYGMVAPELDSAVLIVTASPRDDNPNDPATLHGPALGPICYVDAVNENNIYRISEKHTYASAWILMHLSAVLSPLLYAHISRRQRRTINGVTAPGKEDLKDLSENVATFEQKLNVYRYRQELLRTRGDDRATLITSRRTLMWQAALAGAISILPLGAIGGYQLANYASDNDAPAPLDAQMPAPANVSRNVCQPNDIATSIVRGPRDATSTTDGRDGTEVINNTFVIAREDLPVVAEIAGK